MLAIKSGITQSVCHTHTWLPQDVVGTFPLYCYWTVITANQQIALLLLLASMGSMGLMN